jgi:hypothetical protein
VLTAKREQKEQERSHSSMLKGDVVEENRRAIDSGSLVGEVIRRWGDRDGCGKR